jgi:hypothetical protein
MVKKNHKTLIPLVSFSSSWERWEPDNNTGKKIFKFNNCTRISLSRKLPDSCYGVRIKEACHPPLLPQACLAIFSKTEVMALKNIYAVRVEHELPFVGKWIDKESSEGSSRDKRKVFMVPTPMHLPGSKTSPIASSLHQILLFKDFANSDKLRLIPENKILWKHPLVYVEK